ncbi:MAG: site-specific DNA-methyltransferase [Caulobacteraceae bacterium]|nr:site-specific DNA-methyltransferase [Caulobacteraceae bacterium]
MRVFHADCFDVLKSLSDCSIDSIVTDPPYELGFMGKSWDSSGIAYSVDLWAECLRVLKPGGHLLAFGGTRTWHRLACAVEDAGFEIRDSIAWLYGSGFPKSLDVSKAIDSAAGAERETLSVTTETIFGSETVSLERPAYGIGQNGDAYSGHQDGAMSRVTAPATPEAEQWQGWGTALKPAHEPIVVARKPLAGTVAVNVLTHGTGGINIDACRIGRAEGDVSYAGHRTATFGTQDTISGGDGSGGWQQSSGLWPANVVLDEHTASLVDAQSGERPSGGGNKNGANREGIFGSGLGAGNGLGIGGDTGGASRFYYCAKAPKSERPKVDGTAHPTVKPLTLMRWLCRLVTPPGGTVLEPFAGSGTTVEAALQEGFKVIACEMTAEYLPLIEARIARVPVRVSDLFESVE